METARSDRLIDATCPASHTIAVIHGRWKVPIIYHLAKATHRFSELQKAVGQVSQKVLTQQLRELEDDGIVTRKVYPQIPPKVEYSLTASGRSLMPIVKEMCKWGLSRRRKM